MKSEQSQNWNTFELILMHMQCNEISSNYKKKSYDFRQISYRYFMHNDYSSQREQQNLKSFWCFQMM